MSCVIRDAVLPDAENIAACVTVAYSHYIERIGKPPGPMLDNYSEVVAKHEVFVAEIDRSIVGVLVLMVTDEGLLLDNIAVNPSAQGYGVGQQLLNLAEQKTIEKGYDSIYLYTHERMTENIPYYEKRGYVEYERKVVRGYQRIYMRKSFR